MVESFYSESIYQLQSECCDLRLVRPFLSAMLSIVGRNIDDVDCQKSSYLLLLFAPWILKGGKDGLCPPEKLEAVRKKMVSVTLI